MDQECALPLIPNAEWSGMFSGMFRNMCGLIMECSGMFQECLGTGNFLPLLVHIVGTATKHTTPVLLIPTHRNNP